jgi:hypothetical protein
VISPATARRTSSASARTSISSIVDAATLVIAPRSVRSARTNATTP